jgi:diguanylate cyclase (GGDEF)-like protein
MPAVRRRGFVRPRRPRPRGRVQDGDELLFAEDYQFVLGAVGRGLVTELPYAEGRHGSSSFRLVDDYGERFELADGRSIECVSEPQRLDGRVIGRVWSFRDVSYQRRIEKELRDIAFRDALTGLFNRRRAEETLAHEVERARRAAQPFSVAMLDIDHFKKINDAHGHQVGDDVLRELARDLKKRLRSTDVACRWGGEEFLLILPTTDLAGAQKLVDELRRYIGRERKGIPTFSISGGIAQYDGRALRGDAVIAAADAKLYEAKAEGRNRICA